MKNGWGKAKLTELGFVGRGKSRHRPRNEPTLYGGPYPFIQTGEIKAADLYINSFSQTYNEKGLAQSKIWAPGTLCVTIAANIAETAILKMNACFPDSVIGFIADPQKSDVRFIKYSFDILKTRMQSISKGTTQDNFSLEKLATFDFIVPSADKQRKIASILSAYDDLIENNTRRIKILEEMTRWIYHEWFVEFKAPGIKLRKATPEEKKVTGKDVFPEEWRVNYVEDILEFHIGGGWGNDEQSSEYPEPSFVIRGTDIPQAKYGQTDKVPFRFHKTSNLKSRILKTGDIIFEVSGGSKDQPLGRALLVSDILLSNLSQNVICASFCKLLRVNKNVTFPELFYLHLANIYENETIYKYQVQSTGISNFKFEYFLKNEQLVIPNKELLLAFKEVASLTFRQIQLLGAKNQNLRQTRDLLLPKLISCEVEV